MRSGILCADRRGTLTYLNEKAKKILRLPRRDLAGCACDEALSDHPKLVRLLTDVYSMKTLPNRAEMELFCGGKTLIIGLTVSLIRDEAGGVSGAVLVFKDLTRIEQMAEQKKLQDRLMAIGQMAVGIAHEIRNPLASIEFTVSRLKRKLEDSPAAQALLDKVLSETVRLNGTISHALDFVKPLKPDFKKGDIHHVLNRAVTRTEKSFEPRGIRFVCHYASDMEPCRMDEGLLDQVFLNLLVNAGESVGDQTGRVHISTDIIRIYPRKPDKTPPAREGRPDHCIVVKIADNGRGILKEDRDRIFLPFFTTKESGSGLGLALAQKIIDSHDGQIDLESDPGRGTVFRVKLPLGITDGL
jgi:PAS domain S-box-containing protein